MSLRDFVLAKKNRGHETFHRIELDTFDDLRQRAGRPSLSRLAMFLLGELDHFFAFFYVKMHAIHLQPGDCMP